MNTAATTTTAVTTTVSSPVMDTSSVDMSSTASLTVGDRKDKEREEGGDYEEEENCDRIQKYLKNSLEDSSTKEFKHLKEVGETIKGLKEASISISTSKLCTDFQSSVGLSSVDRIADFAFQCTWNGDMQRTVGCIDNGVNINVCDRHGMTALHWSAQV